MKSKMSLFAMILTLLVSCAGNESFVDESVVGKSHLKVMLSTSEEETLPSPVRIYLFNASGACVAMKTSETISDAITFDLAAGTYSIYAVSGASESLYTLPTQSEATATSLLTPKNVEAGLNCLGLGTATATLDGSAAKDVSLEITPIVGKSLFTLAGFPSDVTQISMTISPFYGAVQLNGSLANAGQTITMACTKGSDGTTWTAPLTYLLPGSGSEMTITLKVTSATGTKSYSYTTTTVPQSDRIYHVTLTYKALSQLSIRITSKGWTGTDEVTGVVNESENSTQPSGGNSGDATTVTSLPAAGTMWNGCFVALTSDVTSSSETLLLLSPKEWTGVKGSSVATATTGYSVGSIADWACPTIDEANALIAYYNTTASITSANAVLTGAGASPLAKEGDKDASGASLFYLCDNGNMNFILGDGGYTKVAGTSRTYNLRAVKTVKVKL